MLIVKYSGSGVELLSKNGGSIKGLLGSLRISAINQGSQP